MHSLSLLLVVALEGAESLATTARGKHQLKVNQQCKTAFNKQAAYIVKHRQISRCVGDADQRRFVKLKRSGKDVQ